MGRSEQTATMPAAARALAKSWDSVFESVYSTYNQCLQECADWSHVREGSRGFRWGLSPGPTV